MRKYLVPLLLLVAACGEADSEFAKAPPLDACFEDVDCPLGLVCKESRCVAKDGLPPEVHLPASTFLTPTATRHHLWVLSPDAATVTAIHGTTLDLRSFTVPAEPVALAGLPEQDAVLVLSREGRALTRIDFGEEGPRLHRFRLERSLSSIALSPDGKWAVLWSPDGTPLDSGLEGLVLLVDVESLARGEPRIHERTAGRRLASVVFREEGGSTVDVAVLAKDEVSVFALAKLEDPAARDRVALPGAFTEPTTRRVARTRDGAFLLLASITSPELLALRIEDRALHPLPLPGAPSDLQVQGDTALAVLREEGKVLWFPFPAALDDPASIREADVSLSWEGCGEEPCSAAPGQARFSPGGEEAHLFTTASPALAFATLDLIAGTWALSSPLRKPIRSLSVGPSGDRLVLIHEPEDSTRADPYEKRVDESEGYSVADLRNGAIQLRLTDEVSPLGVVHAEGERFSSVLLRDDRSATFQVDAIDLETLVPSALKLPSAPIAAGPLPQEGTIWVLQEHPLGRISFVDLSRRTLETITGFAFQGRVQ